MAIYQIQAKDSVVRINDSDAVSCLQDFSWDGQLNAEQLSQIGSANYDAQTVQPSVSVSFSLRSTGGTASMLSRMIYSYDGDGELVPPSTGASNNVMIGETDLERAVFDVIEVKKANEAFDRATLIPRCHLRSISVSASADGTATESYTADGDVLEVFRKPFHDLRTVPVVRSTTNPTYTVEFSDDTYRVEPAGAPLSSPTEPVTHVLHAIDVDGLRIPAASLDVTQGATGEGDVLVIKSADRGKYKFDLGARVHAIIYRKNAANAVFPVITTPQYPTQARFVKADMIDLWLASPATLFSVASNGSYAAFSNKKLVDFDVDGVATGILNSAAPGDLNLVDFSGASASNVMPLLRVQSAEFSLDLQRNALSELRKNARGTPVFYRAAQFPLAIQANLSALESDLNEWAFIQGKALYGADDSTPDVLDLAAFETPEWVLAMRYYKGDTVLQTIVLTDARVSGLGNRMSVGGRAEVSYNFTGSKLYIKGA